MPDLPRFNQTTILQPESEPVTSGFVAAQQAFGEVQQVARKLNVKEEDVPKSVEKLFKDWKQKRKSKVSK